MACARHDVHVEGRESGAATVVARALLGALRAYKLLVSPHVAGSCRYLPSCADYAREAVTLHGAWRGAWLTIRRLSRCHPLGSSGFDPVPGPERSVAGPSRLHQRL